MASPDEDWTWVQHINVALLLRAEGSRVDTAEVVYSLPDGFLPLLDHTSVSSPWHGSSMPATTAEYTNKQRSEFAAKLRALSRACSKIEPARRDALVERHQLLYEQDAYKYKRSHFRRSREAFVQYASDLAFSPDASSRDHLRALHHQVAEDHYELGEQYRTIDRLQGRLSDIEYHLQQKEFKLSSAVSAVLESLEEQQRDYRGHPDSSRSMRPETPSESCPTSPEIHPVLADFYDKAGDAKLMNDRLGELQLDHDQEKVARILREDQGQVLETSWDEFNARHQNDCVAAEAALTDAVRIAEIAKQKCKDNGLDMAVQAALDNSVTESASQGESQASSMPTTREVDVTTAPTTLVDRPRTQSLSPISSTVLKSHEGASVELTHLKQQFGPDLEAWKRVSIWLEAGGSEVPGADEGQSETLDPMDVLGSDPVATIPQPVFQPGTTPRDKMDSETPRLKQTYLRSRDISPLSDQISSRPHRSSSKDRKGQSGVNEPHALPRSLPENNLRDFADNDRQENAQPP